MALGADISGKWTPVADAGRQLIDISVELMQTGSEFTATPSSHMGIGKIDGTLDGGKMTGTLSNPAFGSIPFSATKGN